MVDPGHSSEELQEATIGFLNSNFGPTWEHRGPEYFPDPIAARAMAASEELGGGQFVQVDCDPPEPFTDGVVY